jgi:hypothetical protein
MYNYFLYGELQIKECNSVNERMKANAMKLFNATFYTNSFSLNIDDITKTKAMKGIFLWFAE